jgi:transposase InsO family protein
LTGRNYRLFNVIDDYNREGLGIEFDLLLPSSPVARALGQIIEWRGKPRAIRCDNGPEYISQMLADWAEDRGIRLDFIQPGNPEQNAYVERYNRTLRYYWLAHYLFESIEDCLTSITFQSKPQRRYSKGLSLNTQLTLRQAKLEHYSEEFLNGEDPSWITVSALSPHLVRPNGM